MRLFRMPCRIMPFYGRRSGKDANKSLRLRHIVKRGINAVFFPDQLVMCALLYDLSVVQNLYLVGIADRG